MRVPSLFLVTSDGYIYSCIVSQNEENTKTRHRPRTNAFLPDFRKDWYENIIGWTVPATIEESPDSVKVSGADWEIFTDVRILEDGDSEILHRTTKTPIGVFEYEHQLRAGDKEAHLLALYSLDWGMPDGYIPNEFKDAKKFASHPIRF